MAPIFYCKCSNCICTATVLLQQERQEDKNARYEGEVGEEGKGQVGEEGQKDGGGHEYTYHMSGWERPTDAPLLQAEDQESGVGQ